MQLWQQRDWVGNVRELRNFADKLVLGVADMQSQNESEYVNENATDKQPLPDANSLPKKLEAIEASLIAQALRTHQSNVALAADSLGIPKKTLYDKLKKYQLN
jgi:two-component system C4-dicarboxylate transport response regulator DctD